jgi:excisionase family DNA binding protein
MSEHAEQVSAVDRTALRPLLTVNDVADYLGIGRGSVYRYVNLGVLVPIRVGHRLRFRPQEIEAWLARNGEAP